MPRYRFSWSNLPPGLLRQLGRDLNLQPPVDQTLRVEYGARPDQDFVRDAWPVLLDEWLRQDTVSREMVVEGLQERRLGDPAIDVRSAAGQMEYLRSCRNTAELRVVVVAILMAFGEQEPLRTPVPSETTADDNPAVAPRHAAGPRAGQAGESQRHRRLSDWLDWAVKRILDSGAVPREPDGDIPIRHGSTMCYIRSIDDPPSVRLCAPMVVDVPRTPELLEALNDINMHITVGRVFHTRANEVVFALELYGEQLTVGILRASLAAATSIADRFDHELQSRFGGKTLFAEMDDDSVMV